MQVGAGAAARGGDAVGQHGDDGVEIAAVERAVRVGRRARSKSSSSPIFGSARGHHLLRQDVQRVSRNFEAVELAGANRAHQRGAFDQLIARGGEEAALGQRAHPVAGAADALQRHRDGARRADLADQIHGADIDAQFERGRGHHGAQFAALEARFGFQAQTARQAAVVRQHGVFAEALLQVMRHALGQAARVDEDQRGAILADQLGRRGRKSRPTSRCWPPGRVRRAELRRPGPCRGDGRR